MQATMLPTTAWANAEFGQAALGDLRRTRRLVQVAVGLSRNPCGTLPSAFEDGAALKGAYRLLGHEALTAPAVQAPHVEQTRQRCRQPGEYLIVEDTTMLDYADHPAVKELGWTSSPDGRGLWLHSSLAMRIEDWDEEDRPRVLLQGLLGQQSWVRTEPPKHRKETKAQRLARRRESQKWTAAWVGHEPLPPGVRWTLVADREADIYEVLLGGRDGGYDLIIRANQPRALDDRDGSVFTQVAQAPPAGRFRLWLRARAGQKARWATLTVRACPVTLRGPWRPDRVLPPLSVNVVEVREVDPPKGVTPLHWVLLTSWPCETFRQIRRVVRAYGRRWLVEEFHKVLKTGLGVEDSQLSEGRRIETLVAILSVVGVRLLNQKLLVDERPEAPADPAQWGPEVLTILERQLGRPAGGWTNRTAWIAVARLGGFPARRSDGNPGWLTLWRGWQKLMLLVEGFRLAQGEKCG